MPANPARKSVTRSNSARYEKALVRRRERAWTGRNFVAQSERNMNLAHWPYPKWIAHRGAGLVAPENTLAAFRRGFEAGYRMFECDAKLTSDGEVILVHDATLDRTTSGRGPASQIDWSEIQRLDAGGWHSAMYAGEPVATLKRLSTFCLANDCLLDIEIKPVPGFEAVTGEKVAKLAAELWCNALVKPLLSSFSSVALQAARTAVPSLYRGLLMHEFTPDWQQQVQRIECQALICDFHILDAEMIRQIHALGLRSLAYTVNDPNVVKTLLEANIDGIITDEVDVFGPA